MRSGTKLFALLSLSLGQCIAAPPQKGGTKSLSGYTNQEDEFIIAELTSLPDDYIPLFSNGLWDKIARNHNEKWQQGTLGFNQERSRESLRSRFRNVLIYNYEDNVKVPEPLIHKLSERYQNKRKGSGSVPYNEEEKKLIFQELLKPSCENLYQTSTWEAIHAEHGRRRLVEKLPEFRHERTMEGLRQHVVRHKGQLPPEIVKKFGKEQKGASNSTSTTPNQQTDLQVTNEGQNEDKLIAEMIEELLNNSEVEIDFSKFDP